MDTRALQLVDQEQLSNVPPSRTRYIANERVFAPVRLYAHLLRLFSGILNLSGRRAQVGFAMRFSTLLRSSCGL